MVKDLTVGDPKIILWKFTMPLFISVMFQQMYNIADSVVAGRFAGEAALAAIGASYPITMLFMAVAVGSNIGCAVIISQLFGAKKYEELKTAVYTSLIACVVLSIILSVIGIIFTSCILNIIQTPENIFIDASVYLKIYIAGFIFLYIYNICTGIFTSLGDSKTPLYFLIASSLGNIVLDIIFVAVFDFGISGIAWATFLAQSIACILAMCTLRKHINEIKTIYKFKIFSWPMLKKISLIAIPSILQQSFISIGNFFIQGLINSFGSAVIAGYSAALKLNTFAMVCFTTIGSGVSSFTAQNLGAKQFDRVKKGFNAGLFICIIIAIIFTVLYSIKPELVMLLFLKDSGLAMQTGIDFLHIVSFAYIIISIKLVCDGVLRGSGDMKAFMIATFIDLIIRVVLAFVLSPIFGTYGIWYSFPLGWVIGTLISAYFYKTGKWKEIEL